ncbi:Toxin RelG [Urinicoccus massiliensis]|uniref:Toxin RelG n=1 Tax=Urinicoccus massiliensis TaxID=1723382 RepID=A0A8H2M6X1_9FIRM|nr:type II toxin-antitoxin system RelE/ParE family toxin [Urinicoccus massiliensis]VFB17191.1 Toxin RelG [Urinicoccus massiliensis]
MTYRLLYTEKAKKVLSKLDKYTQKLIVKYMRDVEALDEPRYRGKALSANLRGYWRYRVGDYRIICKIEDEELIILVIDIDHRKKIYKK